MRLVWSPLAIERVIEAADYIAEDNIRASQGFVQALFDAVRHLEDFPNSGRVVPEISEPTLREVIHRGYRIIYRVVGDEVRVLTVRHGRRPLDDNELDT